MLLIAFMFCCAGSLAYFVIAKRKKNQKEQRLLDQIRMDDTRCTDFYETVSTFHSRESFDLLEQANQIIFDSGRPSYSSEYQSGYQTATKIRTHTWSHTQRVSPHVSPVPRRHKSFAKNYQRRRQVTD